MFLRLIYGLVFSSLISFVAYKKKSLSISGVFAAIFLGTTLFTIGHYSAYSLMIIFFIMGSVLSKVNGRISKKFNLNSSKYLKESGCRNHIQVFANGGVSLLFMTLYFLEANDIFVVASAVSFAGAASDTCASEIGSLSRKNPRYLLSRIHVDTGLSGGVTTLGFLASFFGALVIAFCFTFMLIWQNGFDTLFIKYGLVVLILGSLVSIIDSLLGEKFQVKYHSNKFKGKLTEKSMENNIPNEIASGHPIMDNNMVNFLSILISSILTFLFV